MVSMIPSCRGSLTIPLADTKEWCYIISLSSNLWSTPRVHFGPLFFVPLSSNAKLTLYADNIVVYKPINSKQDVHAFQDDINSISKCTRDHSLTL